MEIKDAFAVNRAMWNARVPLHLKSRLYDLDTFVAGRNPLATIERELLGDVTGKRILHLQCHFGQDTIALARMGAAVTGLDISDTALEEARTLAARCCVNANWVRSNVVDHVPALDGCFDIVFTSYGTIGWLPDLRPWAANIRRYLKPGGRLVFVEFHPVIWMFDTDFRRMTYSYFNRQTIVEEEQGTYADRGTDIVFESHCWNHALGDVLTALLAVGLRLDRFSEWDGSPHDSFRNAVKGNDGLYRIKGLEGLLPMVYGLSATLR
jgi:SAM-dependent methyltransferase